MDERLSASRSFAGIGPHFDRCRVPAPPFLCHARPQGGEYPSRSPRKPRKVGPDDGVQRILRTGFACAGPYEISIAVWTRSGRVFAEARVFARGVPGLVGTLRAEAERS